MSGLSEFRCGTSVPSPHDRTFSAAKDLWPQPYGAHCFLAPRSAEQLFRGPFHSTLHSARTSLHSIGRRPAPADIAPRNKTLCY